MAIQFSPLFFFLLFFISDPPTSVAQSNIYTPPSNVYAPTVSSTVAVVVVVMISAFFSLIFFSLYLRRCSGSDDTTNSRIHPSHQRRPARRGLDKAIIDSIPTMVYAEVKEHKLSRGSLECAVCLNEFEDSETLRLLPKCNHAFHTDCIDMWLESHTTCPVCRANLTDPPVTVAEPPGQVVIDVEGEGAGRTSDGETGREGGGREWTEEERERFTLRLPESVREAVVGRRLDRSMTVAVPMSGERGLVKGGRGGWSFKREWAAKSDRWAFLGRTWSLRTPRGEGSTSKGEGSVTGAEKV